MSQWHQRILGSFTADLSRLWVACDPDGVLLDEKLLSELRARGFEVMGYDDPLRAESAMAYSGTVALDIAGLPANFKPLFAGGRTAFVPNGDQVVVHGGVSVEELVVPFVRVSDVNGLNEF